MFMLLVPKLLGYVLLCGSQSCQLKFRVNSFRLDRNTTFNAGVT